MNAATVERIACPCCGNLPCIPWARERGFTLVRCESCRLLYVNPRPLAADIDHGVRLGHHEIDGQKVDVRARRIAAKVGTYQALFQKIFPNDLLSRHPITWVDYGAGYGEIVQAVSNLAAPESKIIGVEPMTHKVSVARSLGINMTEGYPKPGMHQADFISMINIFSHVPDFHELLAIASDNLKPEGEIVIETGNVADLERREEFFNVLDLPDHLVFCGESQLNRYLDNAGFEIAAMHSMRVDGFSNFAKNIVKKILGRPVSVSLPYMSNYRQLIVRARRKKEVA